MQTATQVNAVTLAQAEQRMSKARTTLLLDHPWFGALALRLSLKHQDSQPEHSGFATDGTNLYYDAAKLDRYSDPELVFVTAHEVCHCALLHIFRQNGRDLQAWNEAADYATNYLLVQSSVGKLIPGCLYDTSYADMSAEQIYSARQSAANKQQQQNGGQPQQPQHGAQQPASANPLAADMQQPQQGQGTSQQQAQPTPSPVQAADPGSAQQPAQQPAQPMSAADWQTAAEQAAMVARKAGRMAGAAEASLQHVRTPKTDVVAELRRFVEQTTPTDYSWSQPNRRHIASGLYLPGVTKENTPPIVIAIDTSGSVSQKMLNRFAAILTEVLHELQPRRLHVIYCDSRVQGTELFDPDSPEVKLTVKGRGGTAFTPVFAYIKEHPETYDEVAALVYLTDLLGCDNATVAEHAPDFPTLWLAPIHTRKSAPFGQLLLGDV